MMVNLEANKRNRGAHSYQARSFLTGLGCKLNVFNELSSTLLS